MSAWVEQGVEPPGTTAYQVKDGQVIVPPGAAERKGIQPVVMLRANGSERAEVKTGEGIAFTAVIETPPGTGALVSAAWDFEGAGNYPQVETFQMDTGGCSNLTLKTTYAFSTPGTYFPVLRVASQRQGDRKTQFARIYNLDRVRVVVH